MPEGPRAPPGSSPPRRRLWVVLAALCTLGVVGIYTFDVAALAEYHNAFMKQASSPSSTSSSSSEDWRTSYEKLLQSIAEEKKAGATSAAAKAATAAALGGAVQVESS
jgi:hypothetical protein